jgi:hypothetical protein
MSKTIIFSLLIVSTISTCGCVASSHFHTGRTLEKNKFTMLFGADDIYIQSDDESLTITKAQLFVPSIGAAYGLPLRFETSVRWYVPRKLHYSVRHQINPRSFEIFDGSINLSYAHISDGYSYLRYGISASKDISGVEPYIHYSLYRIVDTSEDMSIGFISNLTEEMIDNSRTLGFGVAIPVRHTTLFPEFNYQYFGNEIPKGAWRFGIGFRVHLN